MNAEVASDARLLVEFHEALPDLTSEIENALNQRSNALDHAVSFFRDVDPLNSEDVKFIDIFLKSIYFACRFPQTVTPEMLHHFIWPIWSINAKDFAKAGRAKQEFLARVVPFFLKKRMDLAQTAFFRSNIDELMGRILAH